MEKVCAIIVVYHANQQKLLGLVDTLKLQDATVIVVVNDGLDYQVKDSIVIRMQDNAGIGAAQNVGIKRAMDEKAKFVCLFDQDSEIPQKYFLTLLRYYNSYKDVGMIVPRAFDKNSHDEIFSKSYSRKNGQIHLSDSLVKSKSSIVNVANPIASGCFFPMSTVNSVGIMNERYFIDAVDTEFDLRIIISGLDIYQIPDVILEHELGVRSIKKIMGKQIHPSNHSASRRYTMARNNIWMWKKYGKQVQGLSHDVFKIIMLNCVYVLFEKQTLKKYLYLFKGILEGLLTHE